MGTVGSKVINYMVLAAISTLRAMTATVASLDLPPTTNDESPGIGAPLALRVRALADETAPFVTVA